MRGNRLRVLFNINSYYSTNVKCHVQGVAYDVVELRNDLFENRNERFFFGVHVGDFKNNCR